MSKLFLFSSAPVWLMLRYDEEGAAWMLLTCAAYLEAAAGSSHVLLRLIFYDTEWKPLLRL